MGITVDGRAVVGREPERRALQAMVDGARAGRSSVLVLRGEAGVGKSVLLDHVAEQATGFEVLRVAGVQSEVEMAFGGLHQLCASMLGRLDELPPPQADALRTAFGLQAGRPPDRFLVGLAVLNLVAAAAAHTPVLCCVDDAQWLDRVSAQTMAFVARRLHAERVAVAFAVRESPDDDPFTALPHLIVRPLRDHEAATLLDASIRVRIDPDVRERILAEARGNPLALLELPRHDLSSGGYGPSTTAPIALRMERNFSTRTQALPRDTQLMLLTAAADPLGDVALLGRAVEHLGIPEDAARAAEETDLLALGHRVQFRHPLVRSAIYSTASSTDRRRAHAALAAVTDPVSDPDRRAWHRAQATVGPDEDVASDLEHSADRARARGGTAAAAAFLRRATELTADTEQRGPRALAAGQAMLDAGDPEAATAVLAAVEPGDLTELDRARKLRLNAQITFARRRGSDAAPLLLAAAERLLPLSPVEARDCTLEALGAVVFAGRLDRGFEVLAAARDAAAAAQPPSPKDLLLVGLAVRVTEGMGDAAPSLRAALAAFREDSGDDPEVNRWLWLACRVAADLFEYDTWATLAHRAVRLARTDGALSVLPIAASYLAGVHMHAGEYDAAAMLMEESSAITAATDAAPLIATLPMLAAYRGSEADALAQVESIRTNAADRGQDTALSMIDCAHAVLLNALGRYDDAFASASRACDHDDVSLFAISLVEMVEAAVRSHHPEAAAAALERLTERMRASGTDWALGLEARSRALVADDDAAAPLYEEAVARLTAAGLAPHRARAQLLHGEWLRRTNQRTRAREQLRAAHETFVTIGAAAFADRARRELLATGEAVRQQGVAPTESLTAQEARIAKLARDGLTNPEIGTRLFLSPHTVEWHLRKVYAKLGITSRRHLRDALAWT